MIVKVCNRGWSFSGAGKYYLHDKRNEEEKTRITSDRVGFVYTHNLPYDGRELSTAEGVKSLNFMAFTAKNADYLKQQAGVSKRGRKAELGCVYSYSLAWGKDQAPDDDEMKSAALASLEFLKLDKNYQSIITKHTDTEHPHVHIITNLISPENGKVANVGNDHTKFSNWAEKYELEHGGIICEKRVENNKKREDLKPSKEEKAARNEQRQAYKAEQKAAEKENRPQNPDIEKPKSLAVKHRAPKIDKGEVEQLYLSSKNAVEFQTGLKDAGYSLARGDRRGLVLVHVETGKTHSLSRQINGLWKKDDIDQSWKGGLKNRFADFDEKLLSNVEKTRADNKKDVEKKRLEQLRKEQVYDREQAGLDCINKELDASEKFGKEQFKKAQEQATKERKSRQNKGRKILPVPANDRGKPSPLQPIPDEKPSKPLTTKEDLGEGNKKDNEKTPVQLARAQSEKWDEYTKWSRDANSRVLSLKAKFSKEHKLDLKEQDIKDLEKELAKYDTTLGRLTGQFDKVKGKLDKQKTDLDNLVYQMRQQTEKLERELAKSKPPDITPESANTNKPPVKKVEKDSPVIDFEDAAKKKESERLSAKDAFKEKMRKQEQERQDRERDKEQGLDYDI